MSISDLIREWEHSAGERLSAEEYSVQLTLNDAARLAALCDMYPRRHRNELLSELVSAALEELERSFPYVQGNQVVGVDEEGDPLYADAGPTPRFLELSRKHMRALKSADVSHH